MNTFGGRESGKEGVYREWHARLYGGLVKTALMLASVSPGTTENESPTYNDELTRLVDLVVVVDVRGTRTFMCVCTT